MESMAGLCSYEDCMHRCHRQEASVYIQGRSQETGRKLFVQATDRVWQTVVKEDLAETLHGFGPVFADAMRRWITCLVVGVVKY